ncbi:MAG: sigma-70 family RNA polymerase sigma factor [Treponema sp.]|nr:sigma-70 family RNA polymerase sigma factor [Treponema sp.]
MKEEITTLYDLSLSPLTKKKEIELALAAKNGNSKARETLIRANIRFALSFAAKFYGHGLSNEDIDAEAVTGLIKAVDHFDPSKGTRLITLSSYYIMDEILDSLNKSGYVQHQSDARARMLIKINKEMRKLNPDLKDEDKIRLVAQKTGFSGNLISELLKENQPCISLDLPVNNEKSSSIQDTLEDKDTENQEAALIRHFEEERLYKLLTSLSKNEEEVLCMLFGLKNYKKPLSLTEASKKLGTTKQNIYYLKTKSLKALRLMLEADAA